MADRDNYRGYGNPGDRYGERGGYGRGRSAGPDPYRDNRGSGRDEDRGFFEKAGEEIRSWFGDEDDPRGDPRYGDRDDHRDRPRYQEQPHRDRGERPRESSGGDAGGRSRSSHPHDEHYSEWRRQQMAELDRDYDEYRDENRDRFHSEFTSWRGQRQQQRASIRQVQPQMEVVGSDGQPVGIVDKVAGDRIILTRTGPGAEGHHHSIPCSWLQSVEERVTINKTVEQARAKWTDEDNKRALFESEDQRRNDGPHILDRSFSGTYER